MIYVSVKRERDISIYVQVCVHTSKTMYIYIYTHIYMAGVEPIKIRTLRRTPACLLAFRRFQGLQWPMAFIFWYSPIFLGLLHTTHTHQKLEVESHGLLKTIMRPEGQCTFFGLKHASASLKLPVAPFVNSAQHMATLYGMKAFNTWIFLTVMSWASCLGG